MKVASALEGLRGYYLIHIFFFPAQVGIVIYDRKIHIKVVFEESMSVHQQSSDHMEVAFEGLTNLHLTVQICDSWITTKKKLKLLHLLVAPKFYSPTSFRCTVLRLPCMVNAYASLDIF